MSEHVSMNARSMKGRSAMAAMLLAGAAVLLAACGSSGSGGVATQTQPPKSTAAPSTAGGTSAAVVKSATSDTFGAILVDSSGMTLYTLTNAGQPVACTGACLSAWPPLLLPSGTTTATGAAGVTGLGTTTMSTGTQVTVKGAPLYHFAGDTATGETNGDGISSFGGTWHVVKTTAAPAAATTPTTAAPAPTTTGGYGY